MFKVLIFIVGVVVGVVATRLLAKDRGGLVNKKQTQEKERRKERVLELVKSQGSVSNNEIEESLGVADSTATKYLQELEEEGKLEQIGETGRSVRYRLK